MTAAAAAPADGTADAAAPADGTADAAAPADGTADAAAPADGTALLAATPDRMRGALGHFASGVTVVTTATEGPDGPHAHGMTANAFTSVSLDPPLVLVSISTHARSHRRIDASGRYGVSILGAGQGPVAHHFAGGAQSPEAVSLEWRDGLPLVGGALVHLACRVRQSHRAGDHTLFVGEVEGLWLGTGGPLVHYRRDLRALAGPAPTAAGDPEAVSVRDRAPAPASVPPRAPAPASVPPQTPAPVPHQAPVPVPDRTPAQDPGPTAVREHAPHQAPAPAPVPHQAAGPRRDPNLGTDREERPAHAR
ncbi:MULTISPECIES: flavin reductase family protein [unclassified Streptomyces]|uniref:flavin reductase family protein n=1 Tax=unclassified Streptomyces TaxID=2593676 RepID=UPI002D21D8A0|nr:flavin reductase [Streptomyces sp. CcalMP-8W]